MTRLLSNLIKSGHISLTSSVHQLEAKLLPLPAGGSRDGVPERLLGLDDLQEKTERKCTELLTAALREREALLEQTRMEIETLKEDARQDGYGAGYLDGLTGGRREAEKLQAEAEELIREAKGLLRRQLLRLEPEIVRLSVVIAERLLGRQLSLLPETIVAIVSQVLQEAHQYSVVLVRVHPEDLPVCRAFAGELAKSLREKADLDFIGDKSLTAGDCLVETDGALLECRLGERLGELREALLKVAVQQQAGGREQHSEAAAQ
jgi:flagellar assembly protein FliH